jgi:hypothetical protein
MIQDQASIFILIFESLVTNIILSQYIKRKTCHLICTLSLLGLFGTCFVLVDLLHVLCYTYILFCFSIVNVNNQFMFAHARIHLRWV